VKGSVNYKTVKDGAVIGDCTYDLEWTKK